MQDPNRCSVFSTNKNPKEDGSIVQIPITEFQYRGDEQQMGIAWKRLQFPLKPSFAMTINKSQGQTLNRVGAAYHAQDVFSHGQEYTGFSRVRTASSIKVLCKNKGNIVKNIVYRPMLDEVEINDAALKAFCEDYMRPACNQEEWDKEVAAVMVDQSPAEVNYAAVRSMRGWTLTRRHLILAYGGEETEYEYGIVDHYEPEDETYYAQYRLENRLPLTKEHCLLLGLNPDQFKKIVVEYPSYEEIPEASESDMDEGNFE